MDNETTTPEEAPKRYVNLSAGPRMSGVMAADLDGSKPPADPPSVAETDAEKITYAARAVHEAIRAYCLAHGDVSQAPWELAPTWARESSIRGVRAVIEGDGPTELHAKWMAERLAAGWKLGPVKDVAKKTHPCLVPYDDLPVHQKRKDDIVWEVSITMLEALEVTQRP